jgi:hypothetical protein
MRRGQQSFDDFFISVRRLIREKRINLGERWRQACQIETDATKQRCFVCFGRRGEGFLFEPREDKGINRIPHPAFVFDGGQGGANGCNEGRVFVVGSG